MISSSLTSTTPTTVESPTIVVAAQDLDVRSRIVEALRDVEGVVRGVASPHELLCETAPDVLIVSCGALSNAESDLALELREQHGALHLIIVCEVATLRSARRAVDNGVQGIVFAEAVEDALPVTLHAVLVGQTVTPTRLRTSGSRASLSFREKQVLGLVGLGYTNGQIGAQLFLAESTVKSHLSSAFQKLEVSSRSEAAELILDPRRGFAVEVMSIAQQSRATGLAAAG